MAHQPSEIRQRLEQIAVSIRDEIVATGTATLGGRPLVRTSIGRETPWTGLCQSAHKVAQMAPDLEVQMVGFRVSSINVWERSVHNIATVSTSEGTYLVDPTIGQYDPTAPMVYAPGELYPLKIERGSMRSF